MRAAGKGPAGAAGSVAMRDAGRWKPHILSGAPPPVVSADRPGWTCGAPVVTLALRPACIDTAGAFITLPKLHASFRTFTRPWRFVQRRQATRHPYHRRRLEAHALARARPRRLAPHARSGARNAVQLARPASGRPALPGSVRRQRCAGLRSGVARRGAGVDGGTQCARRQPVAREPGTPCGAYDRNR